MKKTTFRFTYIFILGLFLSVLSCSPKLYQTVKSHHFQTKITDSIPEDKEILSMIAPYKKALDEKMNQEIGECAMELNKEGAPQNLICNFVADLMLSEINTYKEYEKVDISFGSSGGLRNILPKGKITVRHIYELMPFDNEIVILTLYGSDIIKLTDFLANKGTGIFAGGSFIITKDKKSTQVKINGELVDEKKTYRIVTSDYIANGGDNLKFLLNAVKRENTGILFRDMILNYIKKQKEPLSAKIDDRMIKE
ncbi:MAG: 5'-nucleotidase C-terminal domain-containing protein [Bacteroidia bacterium]|nr:5'-nucleotidase C-terminal domain-containing protein [Bacteroidia bacterium]MDW8301031.1 5'-nucleotidase C-terminal domain-containing protein [Bacteroidia bacterium]